MAEAGTGWVGEWPVERDVAAPPDTAGTTSVRSEGLEGLASPGDRDFLAMKDRLHSVARF